MPPLRGCALVGDSIQALTGLATRFRPSGAGYLRAISLHATSCIIPFDGEGLSEG